MPTPPDTRVLYKSSEGHANALAVYEKMSRLITVPYTTTWVETPAGLTHVLCAGRADAPALLLLHGHEASAPTWSGQLNGLAQHYRLYAPDTPGSLGKSSPTRLSRTGTQAGEWLAATLTGLGITTAHVVGISNGAWLTFKLATVAPQQIKSATLLSAAGLVRTSLKLMARAIPLLTVGALLSPAAKAQSFGRLMGVPGQAVPEQDIEMFTALLGHFKMTPTPSPLPESELRCLTAPTQLLIGEHEAAFPPPGVIEHAKAMLPNLVHSEVLPGVGHGMNSENAALVNARIERFVRMIEMQD
ncbi:MAG: alpha/beta fold hydrolase [Armatimonadetes bacterium]|nr:alpha/beta fold hydrolase [Anaerolineae bacterium]